MTDTHETPPPPAGAGEPDWIAPLFARSEPALAGLYPAGRARRVTDAILARAERRRLRLRQGLAGLMFGALGGLAWLLAAFGPDLVAQANALTVPAGPASGLWKDALALGLVLGCAVLSLFFARPRVV